MGQLVVSKLLVRVYGLPERLPAHANTVCCMLWANDPSLNCLVRIFLRHLVDFLRITLGMRGIGLLRKALALIWGLFHGDICLECESAFPQFRIDMRGASIHHSHCSIHRYLVKKGFPRKGLMLFNSNGICRRSQSSRYL